jgi:hypothetical protein
MEHVEDAAVVAAKSRLYPESAYRAEPSACTGQHKLTPLSEWYTNSLKGTQLGLRRHSPSKITSQCYHLTIVDNVPT